MNSSHKAGFLPPIHPQPYWLCPPAVNWAPYAKAGWPRPSWLWEQTCPQRICNQEVGISACSSPGSTGKRHVSFPWYRICESLKSIIYKTRPLRSVLCFQSRLLKASNRMAPSALPTVTGFGRQNCLLGF